MCNTFGLPGYQKLTHVRACKTCRHMYKLSKWACMYVDTHKKSLLSKIDMPIDDGLISCAQYEAVPMIRS